MGGLVTRVRRRPAERSRGLVGSWAAGASAVANAGAARDGVTAAAAAKWLSLGGNAVPV
jgi:hypothetical protein